MSKIVDLLRRKVADPLNCISAGRDGENPQALVFTFNREPTEAELRFLADQMGRAARMCRAGRDER